MSGRQMYSGLSDEDTNELGELLEFLVAWIDHDDDARASLVAFVGVPDYDVAWMRADLARFAFLCGGTDPQLVFGPDTETDQ